jgi:NTP pyrophosphatase (non-canonical NTP hydrolase)
MTPAELERLAILAEECGEVQQIIGKILRHGYDSHNPFDPNRTSNRELLERELGDLSFIVNFLGDNNDINLLSVRRHMTTKEENIGQYLHYNTVDKKEEVDYNDLPDSQ